MVSIWHSDCKYSRIEGTCIILDKWRLFLTYTYVSLYYIKYFYILWNSQLQWLKCDGFRPSGTTRLGWSVLLKTYTGHLRDLLILFLNRQSLFNYQMRQFSTLWGNLGRLREVGTPSWNYFSLNVKIKF